MLRAIFLGLIGVFATTAFAAAQELTPLPAQPAGVPWPTTEWQTANLPTDMDRPAFDLATTEAFSGADAGYGQTRAVVIVQHGRIVFERYGPGFDQNTRLVSWSMAKSITQALVGAAVLQGRVSIDAPMGNPHWSAGDRRASIPWRQWLNMVDGQRYHEIGATGVLDNDAAHLNFGEGRDDAAAYAANLPLIGDPGAHWNYNSAGYALLCDALTRAVVANPQSPRDRRNRMRAWMDQSLFAPIGAHPIVEFDPAGTFYGNALIWASARDFARFGYLYLRDGRWDRARVLPQGWVDFARSRGPDPNTDIYGAGWWLAPAHGQGRPIHATIRDNALSDAFMAQGHEGQLTLVIPSRDMVIVRLGLFEDTGQNWDNLGDWIAKVIEAFPKTQ